ncbi:MAG: hypothetical protein RJA19_1055 [Bacteroidota bacterium]|jgi:orotate phosphoribosyltransferase
MASVSETQGKVAEFLLQIQAVKLQPNDPFTWASGRKSPIYCDNRKTLSHVAVREAICAAAVARVRERFPEAEAVVGVATGGIALGALVAGACGLPFGYVRSEAKSHGLGNQIEGDLSMLRRVVVIEDLISTGKSSLQAVQALRAGGVQVEGLVAIFSYGFPDAVAAFAAAACPFEVLTQYDVLLETAVAGGYIAAADREMLSDWSQDPAAWSERVRTLQS